MQQTTYYHKEGKIAYNYKYDGNLRGTDMKLILKYFNITCPELGKLTQRHYVALNELVSKNKQLSEKLVVKLILALRIKENSILYFIELIKKFKIIEQLTIKQIDKNKIAFKYIIENTYFDDISDVINKKLTN